MTVKTIIMEKYALKIVTDKPNILSEIAPKTVW